MSANTSQPASSANEHDIDKHIAECRRLIEAGVCPQLLPCMTSHQANEMFPGATMKLWLPKKKRTSVLNSHGVGVHTNNPSNALESRKKQSFFLCLCCYEPIMTTMAIGVSYQSA